MLLNLHVKNLALIDEAEIEFAEGLNILTGETGAGKSILLGSINLALGEKADKDLIRSGEEQALVELTFRLENEAQRRKMEELDLTAEDDIVILQRKISEKRSVCKVCGETVTAKQVKDLAGVLLHIHGQRDNQILLKEDEQRAYLDGYAGEEMQALLQDLKSAYRAYRECVEEERQLRMKEAAGDREISLAQFEVNEIEQAALKSGEDEALEQRYRKMTNGRRIMEYLQSVSALAGCGDMQGAANLIGEAVSGMRGIVSLDEGAAPLLEQIETLDALMGDFSRDLENYAADMEFDEVEFREVEARLDLINHLKNKYHAASIGEIAAYAQRQQKFLEEMSDIEAYREKVRKKLEDAHNALLKICAAVSALRARTAKILSERLQDALEGLNFLKSGVRIDVEPDEAHMTADGYDTVTFMLSLNPGEPFKPLESVASGGELSRIMLALKTLMADKSGIDAMIFDEIDAGISGKTAWLVSEKLGMISRTSQVICITHLPQIAAMADEHFVIEKQEKDGRTVTGIHRVTGEEMLGELARMLGGGEISEAARGNAAEMKETAKKVKQSA